MLVGLRVSPIAMALLLGTSVAGSSANEPVIEMPAIELLEFLGTWIDESGEAIDFEMLGLDDTKTQDDLKSEDMDLGKGPVEAVQNND